MSWIERLLAPIIYMFGGMAVGVGVRYVFFEYHPALTAPWIFPRVWQFIVANVELAVVFAFIGGAIGLLIGIFVAILGRKS